MSRARIRFTSFQKRPNPGSSEPQGTRWARART